MHLYAALDRVLVVRGDRSDPESSVEITRESLHENDLECLAADPAVPDRLFVGTVDNGLQRSTDGGETWEAVGDFDDRVTAVTISPHDPETIWVGTEPSAVYRSTDGGVSFEHRDGLRELPSESHWSFPPRPDTHHVRWLAVHPEDPATLYVAIEAGAFVRTTDAGETWEDHPPGARQDNHTLATHAEDPDRVYTAAGDGYAESADRGQTWDHPQDGLEHRYVWGLAVDPEDPDRVVVSAANGARTAHRKATAEAYVYRRDGNGWELAMDGLPDPDGTIRAVLRPGRDAGEFFACTNRGLFWSEDGAGTWSKLPVTLGENPASHDLAVVG